MKCFSLRLHIFKFNSQSDCLDRTWALLWVIMRLNCQPLWAPSWKRTLSLWLLPRHPTVLWAPKKYLHWILSLTISMGGLLWQVGLDGWLFLKTQSCYLMGWLGQSFPNLKRDNPFLASVLWLHTANRFLVNLWKEERHGTAIFLNYNNKNVCTVVTILDYLFR